MRVISVRALREFWAQHQDAEQPLKAWYGEAKSADWQTPHDILQRFPSADVISGNRIVFNIKGNHYRLIVHIHYNTSTVYIRFVGTHAEYDRVDAETI